MPFYRRSWDESRGDEQDDWGSAVYYFWIHEGVLEQQVERYETGVLLTYDRYHREDQYGQMASEPLDPDEWARFEIDLGTYQQIDWRAALQSQRLSTLIGQIPASGRGGMAHVIAARACPGVAGHTLLRVDTSVVDDGPESFAL